MHRTAAVAALIAVIASLALFGQERKFAIKPAWLWTPDERMEALLDPVARGARVEEHRRELARRAPPGSPQSFRCDDVIDGDEHPELFFANQLFTDLVTSGFVSLPRVYPLVMRRDAPEIFRSDADWQRFAAITAEFARTIAREREILETRGSTTGVVRRRLDDELASVRVKRDPAMVRALRECRTAFGSENFDRMLYRVVARGRSLCFTDTTRDGGAAAVRRMKMLEERSQ
jgi:hypothetical protein